MKIYSIYDTKTSSFHIPFFAQSNGAALRIFMDETNRAHDNNMLFKHPADFVLYEIGTFDQDSGKILPLLPPTRLTSGDEVRTLDQPSL